MFVEEVVKNKERWNCIIQKFSKKDIYFYYGYFSPFKNNGDGKPILYYFECEYGKVAYTFMLRDIGESSNLKDKVEIDKYFDITSVYGYGGPLFEVSEDNCDLNMLKKRFYKAFSNYCKRTNIISQFDRFHPLIKNYSFFDGYSQLINIRKTVGLELVDENTILENMKANCKKNIRRAKKSDVKVVIENDFKTLPTFITIYNSTMKRNEAVDYYFFNDNFFEDTVENLKENLLIANAYYKDKIIVSALIMTNGEYLHYHFAGGLREYSSVRGNNLLIFEVAKWGSENGYKYFHLGGGYESENDSLYRFKKTFSKIEDNDYYIGKKIHDRHMYNTLNNIVNNSKPDETNYFPQYRK